MSPARIPVVVSRNSLVRKPLGPWTTNECLETWTGGSPVGDSRETTREQPLHGLSFPKASVGLSLVSQPLSQLSGPGGSKPPNRLSSPQLWAVSLPGALAAFARLAGRARPRAAARGRRGRRRSGGGLCPPPPPLQPAAGAGGRSAAHRQPLGAGDGGGWRGERPQGLEPTALFKRVPGCASLPRPGNFKAARAARTA